MKLVLIALVAFFAGLSQANIVDTEYLNSRYADVLEDDSPPKFIDPNCGQDCSGVRYDPQCYYLVGNGFRTFDNPCMAKNGLECEDDFTYVHYGRCPKQENNYERV